MQKFIDNGDLLDTEINGFEASEEAGFVRWDREGDDLTIYATPSAFINGVTSIDIYVKNGENSFSAGELDLNDFEGNIDAQLQLYEDTIQQIISNLEIIRKAKFSD